MAKWHYYNENGERVGPIRGRDLKQLAQQGVITPSTRVEDENGRTALAKNVTGLPFYEASSVSGKMQAGSAATRSDRINPPNNLVAPAVAYASGFHASQNVPVLEQDRNRLTASPCEAHNHQSSRRITIIGIVAGVLVAGIGLAAIIGTSPSGKQASNQVQHPPSPIIPAQAENDHPALSGTPPQEGNDERPQVPSRPQPRSVQPTQEQIDAGWTPEKVAVVAQIRRQLNSSSIGNCLPLAEVQTVLDTIDPMLVGKHVAFHSKWLEYIGPNKPLSRRQFEIWRDKTDSVYESFEELLGTGPGRNGDLKIFVHTLTTTASGGHAHTDAGLVCLNNTNKFFGASLQEVAAHGSSHHALMHEIAHIFNARNRWDIDQEGIVDLLIAYAMEHNKGLQYGGVVRGTDIHWHKTVGNQHRQRRVQRALDNARANKIAPFNSGRTASSVHDLYVLGLVDKVGWDVYKQVFRSYNDKDFKPNTYARDDSDNAFNRIARPLTRDFLDRIEHFSGKPDVLRSLPDKGELLDKHFNVEVLVRNLEAPSR